VAGLEHLQPGCLKGDSADKMHFGGGRGAYVVKMQFIKEFVSRGCPVQGGEDARALRGCAG
jgi:hypothetical protein